MGTLALIGLGSNLGDRKAHLDAAIAALTVTPGVAVRAVSSYHETAPAGGPDGQRAFLNAAARLETTLDPFATLQVLQAIEQAEGRVRTVRWGARTLDLDLLIHGCEFLDTPELSLPHPRLALRRFVLAPLAEIAPDVVDTVTGRSIAALLANLDRRPSYLALHGESPLLEAVYEGVVAGLAAFGIQREKTPVPDLKQEASLIQSDLWPPERLAGRWLVSDFSFDHDQLLCIHGQPLWKPEVPRDSKVSIHERVVLENELSQSNGNLVRPTFVVVLDENSRLARAPRVSQIPLLWPEGTEPRSIIAEILATCAGTRSG
jgi:2-amino-4-hydroxy-6-hydroxymethyldihydropteridine diphosphokinase